MGALAKQRADLLIVEASDYFDGAGVCVFNAGGNQCFDSGEGAEFVIHTARKDELFVEAAELGRLGVEKLELPIYDAAIWLMLAIAISKGQCKTYSLGYSSLPLLLLPTAVAV